MDIAQILVTTIGLTLTALTGWYFLMGKKTSVAASISAEGVQAIQIRVKGGYEPSVIEVEKDKPVRLEFYRDETSSCSEEVVFSDFGIRKELPAFETTAIELTPQNTGEFEFTCGMNMLHGKLVVK